MKTEKYIYQLPNATILFLDDPSEEYKERFVMKALVSEDEISYGEIIRDPLPRMTLETMAYRIYKQTDLEYNRKECNNLINEKRRYYLKEFFATFIYNEIVFDGNDNQTTVSSKENIIGLYNALESLPVEYRNQMFPLTWKTLDNSDYEFTNYENFLSFYQAFTVFRMLFEKEVNEKCFLAKSIINQSQEVSEMKKAVNDYTVENPE